MTCLAAIFFATFGDFSDVLAIVFTQFSGAAPAAPLGGIRPHEHVQAREQQQEER